MMPITPGAISTWSTTPNRAVPVPSPQKRQSQSGRTPNAQTTSKESSNPNSSLSTSPAGNKSLPVATPSAPPKSYTNSAVKPSKTSLNDSRIVPAYSRDTPMTPATAQRRMAWNLSALGLLYGLPMLWPGLIDTYYMTLEKLVALFSLPAESDELIDSVLVWLRYALTLVFALNVVEAFMVRPSRAKVEPGPTDVGIALARCTSNGSPLTRADIPLRRRPSGVPSPVTPASPNVRASSSPSPSLRSGDSPSSRAFSAKPFGIGQGRPTTPFSKRIPSRTPDLRTPSHYDIYSVRKASQSPSFLGAGSSQGLRGDQDDAYEVEKALQQLR